MINVKYKKENEKNVKCKTKMYCHQRAEVGPTNQVINRKLKKYIYKNTCNIYEIYEMC